MSTQEQNSKQEQVLNELEHHLVLFNDDVNTFDHVIDCLVDICGHTEAQAEQCAIITHYKGRCGVMNGCVNDLIPIKSQLNHQGLSVEIN